MREYRLIEEEFALLKARVKEFCRNPRNANSSQMPANDNDAITAIKPAVDLLSSVRRVLDCSIASLIPNMLVSKPETITFRPSSRHPKTMPNKTNLGLKLKPI